MEDVEEPLEDEDIVDDDEDDPIATLSREERLEAVDTRVIPIQNTEFVCKNCFLVKHRSQLADKKRMYCRDCA